MAVEYNTPTSALPTDWDYSSDSKYHEYWVDFKEKALQGEWAGELKSKFNDNFGEATKDWTVEDYRNWAEASGFTESIKKGLPSDYQQWTNLLASDDVGGIQRVIGALVMDKKGKFTAAKWETSSSDIAAVVDGMRSYGAQKDLVTNLREKGGTDEQIQGILNSRDGSTEGFESLLNDIENLSGDDWKQYARDNFLKGNILPNNTWGDKTSEDSFTFSEEDDAAVNTLTEEEEAKGILSKYAFGESNLETLKASDDVYEEAGVYYQKGTDKKLIEADDGSIVFADGSGGWSEGGLEPEIESDQDRSNDAEEVISGSLENLAEAGDTSADIQTSITGGDVSTGVADELGWEKQPDGSYKAKDGTEYDVDPKTGMLLEKDGETVVRTEGTMNFAENDFAQDYENASNDFLFGAAISEQAAQSLGFTKTDTGYTGPDGEPYTVDANGNLVNTDNEVARSDGFLDYQTQMTDANAEYVTRMEGADGKGGLLAEYDKAYTDYSNELRPRMDSLDANTAALNEVARDANSPDYYNRR